MSEFQKTISLIQEAEKEYIGTFYLGATTPSFDKETEHDHVFPIGHITREMVDEAVSRLTGPIMQVPPMHSAVKKDGKRAYEIARKGETVELAAKPVVIKEFEITGFQLPEIHFRIVCTKGTYIRSLARDLGLLLNNGAYLTSLCRTRIGAYKLSEAFEIEDIRSKYNDDL